MDDLTLSELDQAAIKKNVTKKQILLEAIDFYLHNDRSELDRAIKDRDQARADLDQRWKESNQLKGEINHYKQDIEALKSREDQLKSELDTIRSEKDQALNLHRDIDHYKATIRLKDDEIGFLRSHLHQLSDKITPALPPSQEEARSKHWWVFWK